MRLLLKRFLKHPYSYAELRTIEEAHFMRPPLPSEIRETAAKLRSKKGQSLLDYWREGYGHVLATIASEPTWGAQRRGVIRLALAQSTWEAAYLVAKDCKHVASWRHFCADRSKNDETPDDELLPLLVQYYIVALLTRACLVALGQKRYGLDTRKVLEIDLFRELNREVKRLDVSCTDLMIDLINDYQDGEARVIGDIKDNEIAPMVAEQIAAMDLVEEQIVNGTLDVSAVQRSVDTATAKKRAVNKMFDERALHRQPKSKF
jgi:hypothetical protein